MSGLATAEDQRLVRVAARALGRAGLVHAYGHCSRRLDDSHFLVCAPRPMGLIAAGEDGTVCRLDGDLPDGVLGEVRIHQSVYRRRPEIGGICRTQPPSVMALSAAGLTPVPRHGFGAYLASPPPLHDDVRLVRDDETAERVAEEMAAHVAVVLRGNGAVVAAESLERAVVLTWYLEDAARVELAVRSAGIAGEGLTPEQARSRATWSGRIAERMWEYLTAGDPEPPAPS
ncbi:MAG TPA: class II aldolase/adducin family protein [Acidimicrobiales bacterium]|nr:class II aldolase/adducin family protein [Acidimicrobiales bacterium]